MDVITLMLGQQELSYRKQIARKLRRQCVDGIYHYHQSELVGDVAVPVSVRQAVLF